AVDAEVAERAVEAGLHARAGVVVIAVVDVDGRLLHPAVGAGQLDVEPAAPGAEDGHISAFVGPLQGGRHAGVVGLDLGVVVDGAVEVGRGGRGAGGNHQGGGGDCANLENGEGHLAFLSLGASG